jgi:hypothetical protein
MPDRSSSSSRTQPEHAPLDAALLILACWVSVQCWSACDAGSVAPHCVPSAERSATDGRTTEVACDGDREASRAWIRGPARLLFGLKLDVNRADPISLQSLPGIGPSRADAIVRARCERPFERLDDLQRVHGIGPKTVWALAGEADVGGGVEDAEIGVACPEGSGVGTHRPMSR